jgi:hypothetical protein
MVIDDARRKLQRRPDPRRWRWYLLLLAPYIGMLWVPFYNRIEPRAGSFPFFYVYQFAWIGVSAVLTAIVYFATRDVDR